MNRSNHADTHYPKWEREELRDHIEEYLIIYRRHLFTAEVKGSERKNTRDTDTKGAWKKELYSTAITDLRYMGCTKQTAKNYLKESRAIVMLDVIHLKTSK